MKAMTLWLAPALIAFACNASAQTAAYPSKPSGSLSDSRPPVQPTTWHA
jgi:hypothetical protein